MSSSDHTSPRQGRRRLDGVHLWSTTVTGAAALGIALFNLFALQAEPQTDVTLPQVVRIAQGSEVWLYLQPTMSTRHRTETVEIIDDARLQLHRTGASPSEPVAAFYWDEVGSLSYTYDTNDLTYQRIADPTPLLVTQDKPQQPLLVFTAERWAFRPGEYRGTLTLQRSGGRGTITRDLCIRITPTTVNTFRSGGQRKFFEFRAKRPHPTRETPTPCYEH
ncbi:hypothetical protein ACFYYM_40175 [Streptomyces erythrochromogenes]|uniref:hypothetical protein n=1 Tax=Streptomyces erythrochromogenes TaxID=285574 RepID=UPI0036B6BEAE